jgi:hypothetical protein
MMHMHGRTLLLAVFDVLTMPVKVGVYVEDEFRKSRVVEEGDELSTEGIPSHLDITYKIEEIL